MGFGKVNLKLDALLAEKGMSVNKLNKLTDMQRSQIRRYRDNKMARFDADILARLCTVFDCKIEDLLEFIPEEE